MAHGPAGIGNGRFRRTLLVEPDALDASDDAGEVGDGGEQCRPSLERSLGACTVIDRRMIAQRLPIERGPDAAGAQVSLGRGAGSRTPAFRQGARRLP